MPKAFEILETASRPSGPRRSMSRYCITLEHAAGVVAIQTAARSWQAALAAVLNFESAPVGAVLVIEEHEA